MAKQTLEPVRLVPGMAAKLLEGTWLFDCVVTGFQVGFVSIRMKSNRLNEHTRLVSRDQIFVLPGERARLEKELQSGIDDLSKQLEDLRHTDDETVDLVGFSDDAE